MYNEYLKAIGQFPGVFTPDECRQLIHLPLSAVDAGVQTENNSAG